MWRRSPTPPVAWSGVHSTREPSANPRNQNVRSVRHDGTDRAQVSGGCFIFTWTTRGSSLGSRRLQVRITNHPCDSPPPESSVYCVAPELLQRHRAW